MTNKILIVEDETKLSEVMSLYLKKEHYAVTCTSDGKSAKIGNPLVSGAKVAAKVIEHVRDRKIVVFKKKRRQNYRRKAGHRHEHTVIEITDIKAA